MTTLTYDPSSRFATDPEYTVVTRQNLTIGTIVIMPVPVRSAADSLYIVPLGRQYRWDMIAQDMLNDPNKKWIIMRHNRIADPFVGPKFGDRLLVPTPEEVDYYLNQGQ